MARVEISGLTKAFGDVEVLRGVDLSVGSGEIIAILGASGGGKTTLLRLLCGFERADGGSIAIAGETVARPGLHMAPERRHIGYVAQDGALFPHLSVADNIVFGLSRRRRRLHDSVAALLELVGLPADYAARGPGELSGGEQQRVALARALAPAPGLVLLDEPFSALDAALRAETRAAVTGAIIASRATALLVTHDQAEALSIGQRVAVLRDGVLVQVATPETLYRRPADAELARFVGEAVLLDGMAQDGEVLCRLGRLQLLGDPPSGEVEVVIRPEQIRLVVDPAADALRARVGEVVYYGHDASVRLYLCRDEPALMLFARVAGHLVPPIGAVVGVEVGGAVIAYRRVAHDCGD